MKMQNILQRLVRAVTCGLGMHKLTQINAYTVGARTNARTTSFHECQRCGQVSEWLSVGNGLVHQRQRTWPSVEVQQTKAKDLAGRYHYRDPVFQEGPTAEAGKHPADPIIRYLKEFPEGSMIQPALSSAEHPRGIRGKTDSALIYDDYVTFDAEQEDSMVVDPELAQALLKVRLPRPGVVNGDSYSKDAVSQLREQLNFLQREGRTVGGAGIRLRELRDWGSESELDATMGKLKETIQGMSKVKRATGKPWLHKPLMITDDHGEILLPGYKAIKANPPAIADTEMGPFLIGQLVYFTIDYTPEYEAQPTAERGRVVGAILNSYAYKQIFTIGYDGRTFTAEHTNPSGYWPDSYEKFISHDVQLEVAPPSVTMTCCASCGTTDIRQNADLQQDTRSGEWAVAATFDNVYCESCEDEVRTVEVVFDLEDDGVSPPVRYARHGRLIEESAAAWAPPTVQDPSPPPNYGVAPITPMTPEEAAAWRPDYPDKPA